MGERFYWLGFSVFPGIGPIKFKLLLKHFGSAKNAWGASEPDLLKLLGEKLTAKFSEFKNSFSISTYARSLLVKKVSFLILTDKEYPKLLSQIKNPPFVLYTKGDNSLLNDLNAKIAVVGTRKTTQYGQEVTKILTEKLVESGFTIVSGLAIGVDAIAHKTALENNSKTIAVLGCGVDCCYPRENQSIYNSILNSPRDEVGSGNCVVSEFPLGMKPAQWTFPARNRIIAGLAVGVLVTEGAEDSGSLITAEYALKFKRKVFAVPGPITSTLSKGPYKLIQKGAKLVTSADDILKELKVNKNIKSITGITRSASSGQASIKGNNREEDMILEILQNEPLHFDEIVRKTKMDSSKLASTLSLMEIKGMIKSLDGGIYSI